MISKLAFSYCAVSWWEIDAKCRAGKDDMSKTKTKDASAAPGPLSAGRYGDIMRSSGLTRAHISRSLRGVNNPTIGALARIAQAAGVTLQQVVAKWEEGMQLKPKRKRKK